MRSVDIFNCWSLGDYVAADFALSDLTKIQRYTDEGTLELLRGSNLEYPLDTDITALSPTFTATQASEWTTIWPIVEHSKVDGVTVTHVDYRLTDGSAEYYWDGANWSSPGASDWSSLSDLQGNFGQFMSDSGTKSFALKLRLRTTNKLYTPKVKEIRWFYKVNIRSWPYEYVHRLLQQKFMDELESVELRFGVRQAFTGTTVDLSGLSPVNGYVIEDVVEAYRYESDRDEMNDIFSSYDTNTKILTLTQSVPAGEYVTFYFNGKVKVALSTHQDYIEGNFIPYVVFRDFTESFQSQTRGKLRTINEETGAARWTESPRQVEYTIPIDIYADRLDTIYSIWENIDQWLLDNPVITSSRTGLSAYVKRISDLSMYPRPDEDTVIRGVVQLALCYCDKWYFTAQSTSAISQGVIN